MRLRPMNSPSCRSSRRLRWWGDRPRTGRRSGPRSRSSASRSAWPSWSGNTGMGGDRNIFFRREGRPIRRSSHILVEGQTSSRAVYTADELFRALEGEDAVVIAHVGGRYADIKCAHDGRLERSVEVHSTWGTFEWLLHDAFDMGYRVGVVCHSDDHK